MNKPNLFQFTTQANLPLHADLYRADKNRKNTTILYFHGGGLLYGTRDDLPELYISKFLTAGYDFLAVDYPLAPEAKLRLIVQSASEFVAFFLKNFANVFTLTTNQYVLFGRSAGAYLAFLVCRQSIRNATPLPKALLSLYGYATLTEASFQTPSRHYNKLARISDESMQKILSDRPVTYGTMASRFSLYIKARQEGTWLNYLCGAEDPATYSLTGQDLQALPPTLLAAATLDPDVPYKMSKTLVKCIPDSHLITVYKEVHDFDRDLSDPAGALAYDEMLAWLETKR